MSEVGKRSSQWVVGNDTGISSKTIWAVMMGIEIDNPRSWKWGTPRDPSDFGRCYRLLSLIPEWQSRLKEISDIFPAWQPFVDNWQQMAILWESESPTGRCPKLYELMKRFEREGRLLDGWQEKSQECWTRQVE